jgi:hypothetical protein
MRKLLFVLIVLAHPLFSQNNGRILEFSDTIVSATVDRPGDLYVLTQHGQLQKFDENGKLRIIYEHKVPPTVFDPRDGTKLFVYYREHQQYEYLNPSLEVIASHIIDSALAIQPWLICPSGDYKLWILDAADNSLKKINTRESVVELEVAIDSAVTGGATTLSTMREYQGFVFLLNPNTGIHVFNALGKHIKTIKAPGITSFNFIGEELYYLQHDTLKLFNLFTSDTRDMNLGKPIHMAILTDSHLFLIQPRSIEVVKNNP